MIKNKGLNNLMKQAQYMQEKINQTKKEIMLIKVTGESGAGLVKITINGLYECIKVKIDKSILNKSEKEILEDLIVAATNDAIRRINEEKKDKMSIISSNMNLPLDFNSLI
ncbi:YbaB/EbfC family nucleoid-associated protein [Buchnera aphidicola (Taiwanaphis decaspermi)]|uniref:YbaB/EbfC family nucleoid-associated protein n=1 Tax=Buchnera aphidicola TaxID=9 RepID=UPI0031B83F60